MSVGRLGRQRSRIAHSRRRHRRGQSTVEFALVVPFLAVALLVTVQVGLIVHAQLEATHLARELARAVAADSSLDVDRMAHERTGSGYSDVEVSVEIEPGAKTTQSVVHVTVRLRFDAIFGLFGDHSGSFTAQSDAQMILES